MTERGRWLIVVVFAAAMAWFDWSLYVLSLGLIASPAIAMLRQPGRTTGDRRIYRELTT